MILEPTGNLKEKNKRKIKRIRKTQIVESMKEILKDFEKVFEEIGPIKKKQRHKGQIRNRNTYKPNSVKSKTYHITRRSH